MHRYFERFCRMRNAAWVVRGVNLCVLASALSATAVAEETAPGPGAWCTSVAIGGPAGGERIAAAFNGNLLFRPGAIELFDMQGGSRLPHPSPHASAVWKVLLSPKGNLLASADYQGTIKIWETVSGQVNTLTGESWVRALAFHPSGDFLAAGNQRGKLFVFKIADGAVERTVDGHSAAVFDVAYTADGSLVSAGADGAVKVWPASFEGEPKVLGGFTGPVWAVAASPVGGFLAAAGADKSIKMWDAAGAELCTLPGHTDWVTDLSFSSDGETLVSVSHDRTIRLWSVARKELIETLGPLGSTLWSVAFSGDGKLLIAGSRSQGASVLGRSWRPMFSLNPGEGAITAAPTPTTPGKTATDSAPANGVTP